ncbi:short-chain collagen C4-like [Haliotis rufescens]|uniref:short-chain collagen C4-like n=1 Tax=Haliotis rufescens TaxID=6454 RepID=UPI00201E916A|nr:short-chain collagen C4-like [Haliotis rufescens]
MFTRWGKTTCPSGNDVMYKGFAGGSHFEARGGPGTTLCLPESPIYVRHSTAGSQSYLYGTEYRPNAATDPLQKMVLHDVPCVVCRSRHRRSAVMVPARNACFPEWHLEYKGYLFGGATTHTGSSDYVCVDEDPESVQGGHENKEGHLLYPVESKCGSLPCPKYVDGWEMTCAVCTK